MCTYEHGNINKLTIYRSGVSLYFAVQRWTLASRLPAFQCVDGPLAQCPSTEPCRLSTLAWSWNNARHSDSNYLPVHRHLVLSSTDRRCPCAAAVVGPRIPAYIPPRGPWSGRLRPNTLRLSLSASAVTSSSTPPRATCKQCVFATDTPDLCIVTVFLIIFLLLWWR